MKSYKYETHFHTSETSPCGKVSAADAIKLYHDAGYTGIVVTDHYCSGFFQEQPAGIWSKKIDLFLKGYRNALEEGNKLGIDVHLGIELRFTENANEYLVYGFEEDFLREYGELYNLGLKKFRQLTAGMGIVIFQAHPFRVNMIPADPELIDGVEIYNGNPRHNSSNHLAEKYAIDNHLKMLSGTDFHQPQDTARGGIIVDEIIKHGKFADTVMSNKIMEFIITS